jgi:hypothetical protein
MEKVKAYKWAIPYIIGYVLWAIFYKVNPLHFDMYVMNADYLMRHSSFVGVLKAVFRTGGCWRNARYLVNIINIYFVSYQGLFDFVMPLMFIIAVYYALHAINDDNKWYVSTIGLALFLLVSDGIVGSCYSYSYVLFVLPVSLVSIFIYVYSKYILNKELFDKWHKKLGFVALVYCCACFNEHLSCAFSVIMIWLVIKEWLVSKTRNKTILIAAVVSLAQTIYMNMYLIIKQTRPLAQNGNELFDILKGNFRVLILETWLSNPIIVCVFLMALIYAVRKNLYFLISDSVLLVVFLVWFSMIYKSGGVDTITQRTSDVIVPYVPGELWWLWAIIYISCNFFFFIQLVLLSERIAVAFFAGACSMIPVLVTSNTGWRISAIYVFMLIISATMLMQKEKTENSIRGFQYALAIVLAIVGVTSFSGRIIRINRVAHEIQNIVDETVRRQIEGVWDIENDIAYLPHFDARDVFKEGRPDSNEYYMWNYCYVNGLDKKTIIVTK